MSGIGEVLGGVINLRNFVLALFLVAMVILGGYVLAKNKRARRGKPGAYLQYVCPTHTAAECRDLLGRKNRYDSFVYTLKTSPKGGWYITFTQYLPTEQIMNTLFLLQFEAESPARFSLTFLSEAFGYNEPVMGEALLDTFFAQKLSAQRGEISEEAVCK